MREREALGPPAFREPRVEINISTGDNTIVAGIAGRIIRVYQLVLWARVAANVIIKDGAVTVNGLGFNFGAAAGAVFDFPNRPCTMQPGNSFVLNVDGAVTGWAEYTQ